jgi:Holliday junction resolvase
VYSHKGRRAEWELRDRLEARGCYVIRSAASRNVDLIAVEPNGATVAYEVKSTSSARLSMNTRYGREQLKDHIRLCARIPVYYAVRFTVDLSPVWRLFRAEDVQRDMCLNAFREDGLPL